MSDLDIAIVSFAKSKKTFAKNEQLGVYQRVYLFRNERHVKWYKHKHFFRELVSRLIFLFKRKISPLFKGKG